MTPSNTKPKIIFLDIDGVLNLNRPDFDGYGQLFHEGFVENLKFIIDNTGAHIVISSSWRLSGMDVMLEMWQHRKLPGKVIGITGHSETRVRGLEIAEYLDKHCQFQRINWDVNRQIQYLETAKIQNYIIIDDDSDMLLGQSEHFIKTSCNFTHPDAIEGYGLTKLCAYKAIKTLNTPVFQLYYPNK